MSDMFEAPDTIRRMLLATWSLLYSLPPAQRARAEHPMTDPARLDWDFIPKPDRVGVPLADLDRHQRTIAHTLIRSGLSMKGYTKALAITGHRPTGRSNDSTEPWPTAGPTPGSTTQPNNATPPCQPGSTSTITTAPTPPPAAGHQSPD